MREFLRGGIEALLIFFLLSLEVSQLGLCENLTEDCIEEERQALLKFRESFEDYASHGLASWKGKQCCKWKGVKCDSITGHVVKIELVPANKIVNDGEWPLNSTLSSKALSPSLLELKHLNYLGLSFIDFHLSPIPLFLGSMKQLRYLNLSHCLFGGWVPHHLGNLTNLQILDLNSYSFKLLYMDDSTWVSRLSSLIYINLSGVYIENGINSMIQEISNLPFLLHAHFMYCGFDSCSISHCFMNSSTVPSKVQVLNLRGNLLSVAILEALQNMSSLRFLDLSDNIINSVPLWLGEFRFLAHLNLARNTLSGLFPTAIQKMSSLRFLDISDNNLDSLPLQLGEFKFLAHLNLARNQLYGFFPTAIQNLSSLKFLDLSENNFTSLVPLWLIKKIQYVNLTHNQFSTLQSSPPWNSICNLTSLDMPDNKFHGEAFGSFDNISVCSKNHLQALDLSQNKLKDHIESLGQLKNLMFLSLASNSFYGPIPLSFGKLTKLRELILKDNQLNGTIPASLGSLSNLRVLDLSGNRLNGIIPDCLGKLLNLTTLDLSTNSLDGVIGEVHLGNLSYLQELRIGMNNLSVKLPRDWLPPFQLTTLQLQSCKIETLLPQWLQTQKKLVNLDLSDSGIWGTIPRWFQQKDLTMLDLSNNKISGQIPRNLHDMMPNLNGIFLGNNLLHGSIPESMCKLQGLSDLDLSKNKLSSKIPSCLGKNDWILLIDLSSNELAGTIPKSFCSRYSGLQSLNLSNNSLHGEFPLSMGSCSNLEILDLGNNQLSGVIPSSKGDDFSSLKILRLRQNKFSGIIPSSLCQLPDLQSLDLASNDLMGTIPFGIGNLKGMMLNQAFNMGLISGASGPAISAPLSAPTASVSAFDQWDKEHVKQVMKGRELDFTKNLKFVVNLDLSNNSLVGLIPEVLTSLTRLVSLNLSYNYLSGEIPSKIGEMKLLESLDLSWNKLAGPLPSSMSSLTSLSHLNLSYNNFSGSIPEGNQFFTLEDSSIYVGNQYLCGEPVLKKCPDNDNNEGPTSKHYEDNPDKKNEKEKILFYFVVVLGFMTGFWGVIGVLVFNKSLRYVCFRYMEKIADEIYVAVAIRVARHKRMG